MSPIERRKSPPRRSDDCAQCAIVCHEIQEGEKASEANKGLITSGLKVVHDRIDSSLPKWVFVWSFGIAMTVVILLAGYQAHKMDSISSGMNDISRSIVVLQTEMTAVKRSVDNKLLP